MILISDDILQINQYTGRWQSQTNNIIYKTAFPIAWKDIFVFQNYFFFHNNIFDWQHNDPGC